MATVVPAVSPRAIYCDDNLLRLHDLAGESVDLVYLDPPFFSNKVYEVIWGDEAEVRSFEDRWLGGMTHYIEWMRQRVLQMHRVLKPTGSLYLHCDPSASHYLKVMLDGIFGGERFRSEVIWKRTSAHSSAKRYGPVHDTLLFYSKSDTYTWHDQTQTYDDAYVQQRFARGEERPWKDADLTGSGTRNGETGLPWRGFDPTKKGRHWAYPPDELDRLDAQGRIYWPSKVGGWPRFKRYLDEARGVPVQDVWIDIPPLNSQARERLGYPTQKPEALLERIIAASSSPGNVVLDPFCGCGTTLAVAERMKRRWIGIDISPTALRIMRRRLNRQGAFDFDVVGLPESEEDLKLLKPFEFQNWVIDAIHGVHAPRKVGDMGIDGYSFLERLPIQVKQSEKVGRNVVDNFETAVRREGKGKGWIVAFSFTRGAAEEAARAKADGLEIGLMRVATLLDNPVEEPLRAGLKTMDEELLKLSRKAAERGVVSAPPQRSAEELVESVRA
ncbi:MAG: DNA methyltransferase [Gaiellaceae bacterium]